MAQKRNHRELFVDDDARKRENYSPLFFELYKIIYWYSSTNKLNKVRHWLDCNEGDAMLFQAITKFAKSDNRIPPLHSILNQIEDVSLDVVKRFIKHFPESLKEESVYELPLHIAIRKGCSVDIIRSLVKAYPDGLKVEKKYCGKLALHIAVSYGLPLDTIKILVKACPESVSSKDGDGQLPLHHIAYNDHVEVLKFLLEAYPEGVKVEDRKAGRLPLHCAIESGCSLQIVEILVAAYPAGLSLQDNYGYIPLHLAAIHDLWGVEVLKFLLEQYPEGLKEEDNEGNLPLHCAAFQDNKISLNTFKVLLEAYPESAQAENNKGNLPLHMAVQYGCSLEVVKALVEAYPEGVTVKNDDNRVPLHDAVHLDLDSGYALRDYVDVQVIKFLLEVHPDGAKNKDRHGNLPLHTSIECDLSLEILKIVILAYPAGVTVQNEDGDLPLHLAVSHDTCVEGIKIMLDEYRGGVKVNNNQGQLPLHIECANERNKPNLHLLNLLVEFYPEGIFQRNIDGDEPSNLLSASDADDALPCALHEAVVRVFSPHLVKLLIKAAPESCMTKDQTGRIPLHQACASNTLGSLDVVLVLLEASAESFMVPDEQGITPSQLLSKVASQKNSKGMLPLHRHARYSERFTVSAIHQLLNAYPKGIEERDNRGMLPFHHACLNTASSVDTLMALLQLYPESIAVVESQVPSTTVTKNKTKT